MHYAIWFFQLLKCVKECGSSYEIQVFARHNRAQSSTFGTSLCNNLFQSSWGSSKCFLANMRRAFMYFLVRKCFCLAVLPWIYFWPVSSDVSHAEQSLEVVLVFFVTSWIGNYFKMFSIWRTLLSLWFVDLTTCGGNFDSTQWLRSFEYFFQTHSLIRLLSSDSTLSLLSVTYMLNWAINICPFVHLSSRFFFSNEMPDSSVFIHEKISFRLKVATTSVKVHTRSLDQLCTFH